MELIETPRLRLEPLAPRHADALYAVYCDDDVHRFLITAPTSRLEFDRVFERALATGRRRGMWALMDRASDALVGRAGFFAFGDDARPELAFLLATACWGRGLATEAALACTRHAFGRHGWDEVIALVRPANHAAIRVLAKLGMRPERTVDIAAAPAVLFQVARSDFFRLDGAGR